MSCMKYGWLADLPQREIENAERDVGLWYGKTPSPGLLIPESIQTFVPMTNGASGSRNACSVPLYRSDKVKQIPPYKKWQSKSTPLS